MLCSKILRSPLGYGMALLPIFTACSESQNWRPNADAGADQVVVRGANVNLNGDASTDMDSEIIDFQWSLISAPEYSNIEVTGDDEAGASFTPDRDGVYTIQLVVVDSQGLESAPDIVSVTAMRPNERPIAHLSVSGSLQVGSAIIFEGEDSYDPDGEVESFNFEIVSFPEGSNVAISPLGDAASITPDVMGIYVVGLTVNDGVDDSIRTDAIVDLANMSDTSPVALCEDSIEVIIGDNATLDGSLSYDPEGAELSYSWAISAKPIGSNPVLGGADQAIASLEADKTGTYRGRLVVNDGLYSSPACETTVDVVDLVQNNSPDSNAGVDQVVSLGDTVTLNGGASFDADGDVLSYFWSFDSVPVTSSIISDDIAPAGDVSPQFTPDVEGAFNVRLTVSDNKDSDTDSVIVLVVSDQAPIADAGPDQNVTVGSIVTLDGTQSSDPDGDPITYDWSFASIPSTSGLSDSEIFAPNGSSPQFVPDVEGNFELTLVVDDGTSSSSDNVVITASNPVGNTPPVADAGADQTVALGDTVFLDGTGSSDADGDPILYGWSFVSVATGSALTDTDISDVFTATPSFTPDVDGVYVLGLGVTDGTDYGTDSIVITVTPNATNTPPVADAGADQTVALGDTVTLDATGSTDADGDPLLYGWSFVSVASGSAITDADLADAFTATPSFTPDIDGTYVIGLGVSDGTDNDTDSVIVTVTPNATNTPPVADIGIVILNVSLGDTVTLDGSGSTDADGDPLTYMWLFASTPSPSNLVDSDISGASSVSCSFTPDVEGTYRMRLRVFDGTDADNDYGNVVAVGSNNAPVADAGSSQTVFEGDTVTLNATNSSDPDGDPLTYEWTLITPLGSNATLASSSNAITTFVADVQGSYVAALLVSDGSVTSNDVTTVGAISSSNRAPTAVAGLNQSVAFGDTVTLDGSLSSDPDGDPLNYTWSFTRIASGSALTDADINGANTDTGSFTPDIDGTYRVQLLVDDGTNQDLDRLNITVYVSSGNAPPVADAGENKVAGVGNSVTMDGSETWDADGDPLLYDWSFVNVPSTSQLNDSDIIDYDTLTPSFTPDVTGAYLLMLTVTDGIDVTWDIAGVNAIISNSAPVASAGADQLARVGDVITVDGASSSDPDGDPLVYSWSLLAPLSSTATLSSTTDIAPTFTADVVGTFVILLQVNDGSLTDIDRMEVIVQ